MASRLLVASLATLRASRGFLPHASRRRHVALRAEDYIESTTNALVKRFKRCHRKKHRDAENVVLVEGRAFVAEVLARGDDVEAVLVADDVSLDASLLARAKRFARAPDFVLKAASTTDSPQGCVALVARPSLAFPAAPDFLLALDGVQDPGNVGALIRTAAAAGVDGVVLVGACADAFNPKTIRGSAGAALRVPLAAEDSWAAAAPRLAELNVVVADAGAGAVDHLSVESWAATCLVVGAEAGLTDDLLGALGALRATRVRIDVDSSVESLNAAVAGSYLLLDARRRRRRGAKNI